MTKFISNKITILNFIMTMCVVIYHFWYGYGGMFNITNHWTHYILIGFNGFCNLLGTIAMATFFLMSGFLLYNGANNSKDIFKKWKNRFFTLFIPFLIWNSFMMLYQMIMNKLNPFISFKAFISGYFISPFNGPLWYMLALLGLMLVAPLVIKLKNHKKLSIVVMFLIIILSQIPFKLFDLIISKIWYIGNILNYLPLYVLGAFAGMHYSEKILNQEYNVKRVKIISLIILLLCLLLNCILKNEYILQIILMLIPISIWFIIDANIFTKNITFPFKVSFFMYVLHSPFLIDISYKIMSIFYLSRGWMLPIEAVVYRILGTFLIWGLSILIAYICRFTLSEKVWKSLSGNRANQRKTQEEQTKN